MTFEPKLPLDPDCKITQSPLADYRPCSAIVVYNEVGQVLIGKRTGDFAFPYQFPQGGIEPNETASEACMRELAEETGIDPAATTVIGAAPNWLSYDIPKNKPNPKNHNSKGQVQAWFLLSWPQGAKTELTEMLARATTNEFSELRWEEVAQVPEQVIEFKRPVYREALAHFKQSYMAANPVWQDLAS